MTVPPDAEGVRIRPAERADLLAIHRIERASFSSPWPFEAFERFVGEPGFLVAQDVSGDEVGLAENDHPDVLHDPGPDPEEVGGTGSIDDAGVVGFVIAEITPNHGRAFGHIKDLAVHPEYRRRGIASTLLERAIVTLAGEGATSVKLEVRESNEAARSLYESFGFSPMRRRGAYYEDGEDALVLAREL